MRIHPATSSLRVITALSDTVIFQSLDDYMKKLLLRADSSRDVFTTIMETRCLLPKALTRQSTMTMRTGLRLKNLIL